MLLSKPAFFHKCSNFIIYLCVYHHLIFALSFFLTFISFHFFLLQTSPVAHLLLQHDDNNHKNIFFMMVIITSSLHKFYFISFGYDKHQLQQQTVPQTGPPRITFKKRQFFIGEKLIANCTTSKAQPAPHITWLINGKKVNFILFIYLYAPKKNTTNVSLNWWKSVMWVRTLYRWFVSDY